MDLFGTLQGVVTLGLLVVGAGLKAFALVDALRHAAPVYPAAGKQTKTIWLAILGVTCAVQVVSLNPLNFLNLLGVVAAAVYLVDVRPALKQLRGYRGGSGGQQMGPYGPW